MEARSKRKNFLIPAVKASMKKIGCFSIILLKETRPVHRAERQEPSKLTPKRPNGVAFPEVFEHILRRHIFQRNNQITYT